MNEEKHSEVLPEVERERQMGSRGTLRPREIPLIDFSNFSERRQSITEALWDAAANYGFFQLINHGIPTPQIDSAFLILYGASSSLHRSRGLQRIVSNNYF